MVSGRELFELTVDGGDVCGLWKGIIIEGKMGSTSQLTTGVWESRGGNKKVVRVVSVTKTEGTAV